MKNNIIRKSICLAISFIITLLLIIFMISNAVKNEAFNEYGFELDEMYLFYVYACLSFSLSLVYNLVYYIKKQEENELSMHVGIFLFFAFLCGYYTKTFFKAINKYGSEGFDSFIMILMLIFISTTIYSLYKIYHLLKTNKTK